MIDLPELRPLVDELHTRVNLLPPEEQETAFNEGMRLIYGGTLSQIHQITYLREVLRWVIVQAPYPQVTIAELVPILRGVLDLTKPTSS